MRALIDIWEKKGAKSAREWDTLDEAIAAVGKLPKSEQKSFIHGFYLGRVTSAIQDIQSTIHDLENDPLVKLGDELQAIVKRLNDPNHSNDITSLRQNASHYHLGGDNQS